MEKREPAYNDVDMTIENYRTFSLQAIFTFVVSAIASVVCLVNYNLLVLGGFAAAFAAITLIRLHRIGRNRTTGFVLATIALILPLFCMTAVKTYRIHRMEHLWGEANRVCQDWLKVVHSGDLHTAYQLTQGFHQRQPAGADLAATFGTLEEPKTVEFIKYLTYEPEKTIAADGNLRGKDDEPVFEWIGRRHEFNPTYPRTDIFMLQYRYQRFDPDLVDRIFRVRMRRHKFAGATGIHWNVEGVINDKPFFPRERAGIVRPSQPDQQEPQM